LFDLTVALMAFLGGFGTLAGPVLGALILEPLQQWIGITFTNGYTSDIVLGVLFLVVILFLPRGIVPTGSEYVTRWRAAQARRRLTAAGGTAPPGNPEVGGPAAPAAGTPAPGSTATGSPTTGSPTTGTPSTGGAR
jgi:branched-chain amino acid transport system permease protein